MQHSNQTQATLIKYLNYISIDINTCKRLNKGSIWLNLKRVLSFYKMCVCFWARGSVVSSDEFRNRLEIIRNSTENVEFRIRIWGRIWALNSNSTKFDCRIWPKNCSKQLFWLKNAFYNPELDKILPKTVLKSIFRS